MSIVQTRDSKPAHYDGLRGLGLLDDPVVSKGTAFTEDEREAYGLEGTPAAFGGEPRSASRARDGAPRREAASRRLQ